MFEWSLISYLLIVERKLPENLSPAVGERDDIGRLELAVVIRVVLSVDLGIVAGLAVSTVVVVRAINGV